MLPFGTGMGYIDGRQVMIDDMMEDRLGGRLSQSFLPSVHGIDSHGHPHPHGGQVVVSGGLGVNPLASLGHLTPGALRECPRNLCSLEFIPRRCRYTPVMRTGFGTYCLGCPEDICETQNSLSPRQRRRRRRMRRRLCRDFGICLGRTARNGIGAGRNGIRAGMNRIGSALF